MKQPDRSMRWPTRFPVGVVLGLLLAGLASDGAVKVWESRGLTVLERFYLAEYSRTSLPSLPKLPTFGKKTGEPAPLREIVYGRGLVATSGLQLVPVSIVWLPMTESAFHHFLAANIFRYQPFVRVIHVPVLMSFGFLLLGIAGGAAYDVWRKQRAADGELLRGSRKVSAAQFTAKVRGLWWRKKKEFVNLPVSKTESIAITEYMASRHIGLVGTTGSGKSTLVHHLLQQVAKRGDIAIVLDPSGELHAAHFKADRGDMVLDATSADTVRWAMEREALDEAQATPWGHAFFPGGPGQQPFFLNNCRNMFSYLMAEFNVWNHPADALTCGTLGRWLVNPLQQLLPRFASSEFKSILTGDSKDMQSGLFATLAMVGKSMRMMPEPAEGRREFCVREYCRARAGGKNPGWIFLTSSVESAEATMPLKSAIIDNLILGMQKVPTRRRRVPHVWFFLDEVATTLTRVPQLVQGMTNLRKASATVVLGIHDVPQLREKYGVNDATTVMNNCGLLVALQFPDPDAAEYLQKRAGQAEVRRLIENRPVHTLAAHKSRSWTPQIQREDVVMGAEFMGLDEYCGYVLYRGMVLPLETVQPKLTIVAERRERLIPRIDYAEPIDPDAPVPVELDPLNEPVPVELVNAVAGAIAVPVNDIPPPPAKRPPGRPKKNQGGSPLQKVLALTETLGEEPVSIEDWPKPGEFVVLSGTEPMRLLSPGLSSATEAQCWADDYFAQIAKLSASREEDNETMRHNGIVLTRTDYKVRFAEVDAAGAFREFALVK